MDFVRDLIYPHTDGAFTHAWINLLGNVLVFIPLGILLPLFLRKLRRLTRFFMASSAIILSVELVQLFTLRGICDVDDYLLNMVGMFAGFILFRLHTSPLRTE
jgi:glycopeptide antibiotics resistance protein